MNKALFRSRGGELGHLLAKVPIKNPSKCKVRAIIRFLFPISFHNGTENSKATDRLAQIE